MSRELTKEEVRTKFLKHVWGMIEYWDTMVGEKTSGEKLSGLTHSILAAIDGCSTDLPGFILAPSPHESDKQYLIDNDEDYFPENHENDVNADIGGCLHELLYPIGKEMGLVK